MSLIYTRPRQESVLNGSTKEVSGERAQEILRVQLTRMSTDLTY
jgi:hypothetical protein